MPEFKILNSVKNKKDKQWYKDMIDYLDSNSITSISHSERKKEMSINFDLFNGKINQKDFEYVCKPYGDAVGESLIKLNNKDITSNKISSIMGIEMKRPFIYNAVAVNPEATTRKEQKQFELIKDFVIEQITIPIRTQIEQEKMAEAQGRELSPEELQQIEQQIKEELEAMTPDEVHRYMQREYQDPAEVLANQLLAYLTEDLNLVSKFNKCFKYGLLSSEECIYIGATDKGLIVKDINPLRLTYSLPPDEHRIEKSEWVTYEYLMTPTQIIENFGSDLSHDDITKIYEYWYGKSYEDVDLFDKIEFTESYGDSSSYIRVTHCSWKSLRKVGFLTYIDEDGIEAEKMVSEEYKLDETIGDIEIHWDWLPETYEGYKIKVGEPIYVKLGPTPGQLKDIDNARNCLHPYVGIVYNNMNSTPVSLMTRLKNYQYFYNIIWYRLETLIASDKGKKVLMNIGYIPTSSGIDVAKWQYFFENTPYVFYDPAEEGNSSAGVDAGSVAKVLDLSLASDIQKYIQIAEFIDKAASDSVGINPEIMGQISPRSSVVNAQTNISQSTNILEPYFNLHGEFKKNVLQILIDKAKVFYSGKNGEKLAFVIDDLSQQLLTVSSDLLENNKFGIFVSDATKIEEIKNTVVQLSHAAMQNQTVEFSDVIAAMKQTGLQEAEEILKVGEMKKQKQVENMQKQKAESDRQLEESRQNFAREQHEMNKELIIVKEEERRKTVIQEKMLLGASFNPDLDENNNQINDFLEIDKSLLAREAQDSKTQLERDKLEYQKERDREKNKIEREKIASKKLKNK